MDAFFATKSHKSSRRACAFTCCCQNPAVRLLSHGSVAEPFFFLVVVTSSSSSFGLTHERLLVMKVEYSILLLLFSLFDDEKNDVMKLPPPLFPVALVAAIPATSNTDCINKHIEEAFIFQYYYFFSNLLSFVWISYLFCSVCCRCFEKDTNERREIESFLC